MKLEIFKNDLFEVKAKLDNGNVLFDAETIAKNLGFTQYKKGIQYIRWDRVNSYLNNSPQVGKGDLIPESVAYMLAFKAKNEKAEKFQQWLAVDVVPAIRRHGAYMTDDTVEKAITDPDFLIQLATNLKEEKAKRALAEAEVERNKPKVLFATSVEGRENSCLIGELAKLISQNGYDIGQNRLFSWMRENGFLIRRKGESYNLPTQYSMDLGLMEVKKRAISNPDGSVRTTSTTKVTGKGQIYFVNKFVAGRE